MQKKKKIEQRINKRIIIITSISIIGIILVSFLVISMLPEQVMYPEGYYDATYTFTDDEIGVSGIDISWIDSGYIQEGDYVCKFEVIEEFEGHSKVIEYYDESYGKFDLWSNFGDQEYGTIEFWWTSAIISSGDSLTISLYSPDLICFALYLNSNGITSTSGSIKDVNPEHWYHIRIDFECGSEEHYNLNQYRYDVYVDGEVELENGVFLNSEDEINRIRLITGAQSINIKGYIDAVGYSWDSGYEIGDNIVSL